MAASPGTTTTKLPYYILVALNSSSQSPSSNNLRHPAIQYHYEDDSPLSLLPQHQDEHVLILNYDQDSATATTTTVHSISPELITTGLKIEDAPAAAAIPEDLEGKDDRMFIIETTRDDRPETPPHEERKSATAILEQFKRRNNMLHHALSYPSISQHAGIELTTASPSQGYPMPSSPPVSST
ncbi:hypothetical protein FA15DRAFT_18881 [Coprinopsis marcescibilis]|uniref:Uncharacterized protein n=1 Tax=Coprinopsis marcescibilis TaxID=230819 RepID=A0A5C3LC28_COPMA|nr:hypothetical protein FA15DRAFT_18881 [Coprinopsis marcescibilis]